MKINCLSIAGLDPSASAGLFLDLKIFDLLGVRGMGIVTLLTAQSANDLVDTKEVSTDFLFAQLEELFRYYNFSALKIGVVGENHVEFITKYLKNKKIKNIIIDPVLQSSSGYTFIEASRSNKFFSISTLLTPNINEAEILSEIEINNLEDQKRASKEISKKYSINSVFIKGGHAKIEIDNKINDVLLHDKEIYIFQSDKYLVDAHIRGTGCAMSSLIAANLALGLDQVGAVEKSVNYLQKLIRISTKKIEDKNYTLNLL